MKDKKITALETAISGAEAKDIINISTDIISSAQAKIKSYDAKKIKGQVAKAIAKPTAKALCTFCKQSEEFARAVIDNDKGFEVCLAEISKGIGSSVSDIDVYQKAVEFYFPGAKVEFRMLIHMSEYETDKPEPKQAVSLSLDSLLDW